MTQTKKRKNIEVPKKTEDVIINQNTLWQYNGANRRSDIHATAPLLMTENEKIEKAYFGFSGNAIAALQGKGGGSWFF